MSIKDQLSNLKLRLIKMLKTKVNCSAAENIPPLEAACKKSEVNLDPSDLSGVQQQTFKKRLGLKKSLE
jgi:hypothetical protein